MQMIDDLQKRFIFKKFFNSGMYQKYGKDETNNKYVYSTEKNTHET